MKIVKCGDLGFRCNFIATGTDAEQVKKEMLEHIEKEHKDLLEEMSEDDINHIKYRISTLLSRGCGCGAL